MKFDGAPTRASVSAVGAQLELADQVGNAATQLPGLDADLARDRAAGPGWRHWCSRRPSTACSR